MTSPPPTSGAVPGDDRAQLRAATDRLQHEYAGVVDGDVVERLVSDSYARLAEIGTDGSRPVAAERFARDRLRAVARREGDRDGAVPSVLFLCVHNAGRSQMAAGWMRHLGGDGVDVLSGGSAPASQINPAAVAAMREVDVDITAEVPRPWTDEIVEAVDVVVTMGCGDACPVVPGTRYVDWELEDPAGRPVEDVRPVRDEIEQRVRGLLRELGVPTGD